MKTPVSRCLLLKKHRKKANITATVIQTMAIMNFHIDETPYEWSISIRAPMPAKLRIERKVTTEVIALGKHWTSCDQTIPIAKEISMLSFMES